MDDRHVFSKIERAYNESLAEGREPSPIGNELRIIQNGTASNRNDLPKITFALA
jgi:hypothetical protein